jgi:hypothetical protein
MLFGLKCAAGSRVDQVPKGWIHHQLKLVDPLRLIHPSLSVIASAAKQSRFSVAQPKREIAASPVGLLAMTVNYFQCGGKHF